MQQDSKTILEAGMILSHPQTPGNGGAPFIVRPNDASLQSLESLMPNPMRIRQKITLHDPEAFIAYVSGFKEPGTVIFYDEDHNSFTAILDYHEGGTEADVQMALLPAAPQPRWCSHKAVYTAKATPEWLAWTGMNARPMRQIDFATFLEDRIDDVAEGYGATLLKIALALEIKKDVRFVQSQRLEDGSVKFAYEEDVQGTAQMGALTIPPSFRLQIQPFVGGPTYQVECRFRYKLENRAVSLWFEMVQLDKLIENALGKMRLAIEEGTGVRALAGAVERGE